jgi:hypothetical protein
VSALPRLTPSSLNWTLAAPEPPSVALAETATALPFRNALAAGAVTELVGAVLSTRTLAIVAELKVLPALSDVTALRSYNPSETAVVSQLIEYGLVESLDIVVQVPVPAGERWNVALATPEPPSAELEVRLIVPFTIAAAAGAVRLPVGAVLSTLTLATVADVKLLPALSAVITLKSYNPSVRAVVSKETE